MTAIIPKRSGPVRAAPDGFVEISWNSSVRRLQLTDDTGLTVNIRTGVGSGASDHTGLSNLAWGSSGHTSTADRLAGFDGAGLAAPVSLGTGLSLSSNTLSLGADLVALDALGNGIPYRDAGTWSATSAGDLALSGGSWQVTQARGIRETSGPTTLAVGAVADGELLQRVGTAITSTPYSETPGAGLIPKAQADGTLNANWLPSGTKAIELFTRFSTVIPSSGTSFTNDGAGVMTTNAIHTSNVSSTDFPCVQIGDASGATCRVYVTASWRTDAGTTYIDAMLQLGSDISGGTQQYYIGLTSQISLAVNDPTGHRVMIKRNPGDANWTLTVKDGTTESFIDTGVAFTASWFYRVRFVITSTEALVYIGLGATAQDAIDDFDSATSVGKTTNLPGSTTDLILIVSLVRSAASTNRGIKLNSLWTKTVPAWAA